MPDLSVLLVQPDGAERARTLGALALCCDPLRLRAVATPAEALPLLEPQPDGSRAPQLVLLQLPAEVGLQLLHQLRSAPATAGLPVIAMVPPADRQLQDTWYRAGANSVVGTTPDDGELREKMRRLHAYWTTVNVANRASRV